MFIERKFPNTRLRRLRRNTNLIDLVSETNLSSNDLIQPIFIKENFDFDTSNSSAVEQSFDVVASCIEMVYDQEDAWAAADCTKKELSEWVETLSSQQFKKVEQFFNTMPKLSYTVKVKNPKTKVESEVVLEGLSSFFG